MKPIIIVLLSIFGVATCVAQPNIETLKDSLGLAQNIEERVERLNDLAQAYFSTNPEQGRVYAREALQLSIDNTYGRGIALSNLTTGITYKLQGNLAEALKYETRALEQYEVLQDKQGMANALYALSLLLEQHSDYKSSMEYAVEARHYFNELADQGQEANVLDIIGTLFFRQGDLKNAEKYYKQAITYYEQLQDTSGMAGAKANLGMLLGANGRYEEAMGMLKSARAILEKNKNYRQLQSVVNNMGLVENEQGNLEKAMAYLEIAWNISHEQGHEVSMATARGNMGAVYLAMAKNTHSAALKKTYLSKAEENLTTAISACHSLKCYDPTIEFYKRLSQVYQLQERTEEALTVYQKSGEIKDSIHSINNRIMLTNLTVTHELQMANRDLQLNQQKLTINELELEKSRQQIILYAVSLVALICLVAIAIYFLKQYRERNERLEKTNEAYAQQVEEQMNSLKKHTKVLNEIAYMQAHDVREPLATILGLIDSFNYDDPKDPDNAYILNNLKMVTEKLDKAVREVIQKKEEL